MYMYMYICMFPYFVCLSLSLPNLIYSSAELQERVRSVKERVKVVEGDLEEGREERNAKYRELRTREEKIRLLGTCSNPYSSANFLYSSDEN